MEEVCVEREREKEARRLLFSMFPFVGSRRVEERERERECKRERAKQEREREREGERKREMGKRRT